jgi:hypothetical protein
MVEWGRVFTRLCQAPAKSLTQMGEAVMVRTPARDVFGMKL